jgi:hypothetical protein
MTELHITHQIMIDDSNFLYYICGDDKKYKKFPISFDGLCYRLATCMFDCDGDLETLLKIKKVFGTKVFNQVCKNLVERNHDT